MAFLPPFDLLTDTENVPFTIIEVLKNISCLLSCTGQETDGVCNKTDGRRKRIKMKNDRTGITQPEILVRLSVMLPLAIRARINHRAPSEPQQQLRNSISWSQTLEVNKTIWAAWPLPRPKVGSPTPFPFSSHLHLTSLLSHPLLHWQHRNRLDHAYTQKTQLPLALMWFAMIKHCCEVLLHYHKALI